MLEKLRDIRKQFDIVHESENIIQLNPDDQKLKILNLDYINVIFDDNDIVVGVNAVYKNKTLQLIPTALTNK